MDHAYRTLTRFNNCLCDECIAKRCKAKGKLFFHEAISATFCFIFICFGLLSRPPQHSAHDSRRGCNCCPLPLKINTFTHHKYTFLVCQVLQAFAWEIKFLSDWYWDLICLVTFLFCFVVYIRFIVCAKSIHSSTHWNHLTKGWSGVFRIEFRRNCEHNRLCVFSRTFPLYFRTQLLSLGLSLCISGMRNLVS